MLFAVSSHGFLFRKPLTSVSLSKRINLRMVSQGGIQVPTNKKFIAVTGGVISGIGKGVTASSIGVLMKMLNLQPTAIKIDPYLNVDAGTMSPFEHGEVFVLGMKILQSKICIKTMH
jgi:hypothetical protein